MFLVGAGLRMRERVSKININEISLIFSRKKV